MSSMFFVVCIVAIACTAGVVTQYLKSREKREDNRGAAADVAEYAAQIETLEERIRVLERIVTENKFDLGREIDKL